MIDRPFWTQRLEEAWKKVPIVWLTGPRRVGKTVLVQAFSGAEFLNCDLPSVEARLSDPELFYQSLKSSCVVFDEVHQLPDPSRLLKIGADAFPHIKIVATGSSTLAATQKFRDSLTGRKRVVRLIPVLYEELDAFGVQDLGMRLLRGGMPSVLLAEKVDLDFYGEWIDSYFARDVQELFRIEKRAGFLKVLEILLRQSGGMLDISKLATESQISRPTIMNWLEVFEMTHVIHLVRPYSGGGKREVLTQPKVFGFDTGFVCYARGWNELRVEDLGVLWEHMVLDTLIAAEIEKIHYWRDKQYREVDFVIPHGRNSVDTIECKWNPKKFDSKGIKAFRQYYPEGKNYVVSPLKSAPYVIKEEGMTFHVLSLGDLRKKFSPL